MILLLCDFLMCFSIIESHSNIVSHKVAPPYANGTSATVECWFQGPHISLHGGFWVDINVNWQPHYHQDLELAIKGYCIV